MKNKTLKCTICGKEHPESEMVAFDGERLCPDCLRVETVLCRCCHKRIWRNDTVDTDLCHSCFNEHYTTCTECGSIILNSDAYYLDESDSPYCENCFANHSDTHYIHDYYYRPEPVFFGCDESLYMGVELEIDEGGEYDECAADIFNTANLTDDHVYIKHDGSLNEGMEIVTHPMTLSYHKKTMPWKEILRKAVNLGYHSHQAETCGLHIHVNRNTFGNTVSEQEEVIARILFFYEKFWAEILRFSRRSEYHANRWASRYGGVIDTCKGSLDTAKKSGLGRYTAVNLTNENTVEFRIFRGTLRYDTLMATIEFTHHLCKLAISFPDEVFHSMSWLEFASGIDKTKYPELIDYLKRRRLYINEPTAEQEEI